MTHPNQQNTVTYRAVAQIHAAPSPHWVGDGFHVNPMFNHMVGDKRTDPFLMLDYAAPQHFAPNTARPRGVGQHPHKGFETVTIAYHGEVAHRDSSGGGGTIREGDVQWMTAGNGVIHEEFHSPEFSQRGGDFSMVQLWVNLPAKDKAVPARYQHLAKADMPVVTLRDATGATVGRVRVMAGAYHADAQAHTPTAGLAKTFSPINLWDVSVHAHASVELMIPSTHNLLLLVRAGAVMLNADSTQQAAAHQLVTFAPETPTTDDAVQTFDRIRLTAGAQGVELVLMSGEPLNEPIVGYGPFVMNSAAEIQQAMADFRHGKFGQIA